MFLYYIYAKLLKEEVMYFIKMSQLAQPHYHSDVTTNVNSHLQTRASTLIKTITNSQITLKHLLGQHYNKNIYKPEVQRKMIWSINGPVKKGPSFRRFLDHFFKHKDALQILVADNDNKMILVDGNNRANAWLIFCLEPYRIYPDYFKDIEDTLKDVMENENLYNKIVVKISKLTYNDINKGFDDVIMESINDDEIKNWWDALPGGTQRRPKASWKKVRSLFKFSHGNNFNPMEDAKISVKTYRNYKTFELMEIYRDINSNIGNMSEFDILAATLGAIKVTSASLMSNYINIMSEIKTYYNNRNRDDEVCEQFKVTDGWIPSLFALLLGLQETMAKKYELFSELNFKEAFEDTNKLPFIYRLWNIFDSPENNLDIIDKLINFEKKLELSCQRLKSIMNKMWPELNKSVERETKKDVFKVEKFNDRKFWKQESIQICMLLSVLGSDNYTYNKETNTKLKRIIHYHLAIKEWRFLSEKQGYTKDEIKFNKDEKKQFQTLDWLNSSIPTIRGNPNLYCSQIHINPDIYLDNCVTREQMRHLIETLVNKEIIRNMTTRNDQSTSGRRRKPVSYLSFTLMYTYWYKKMTQSINDDINENGAALHNDHIFCFSSRSKEEINNITLDRLGNLCPIMGPLNCARGNKSVSYYWNNNEVKKMLDLLNIYPTVDEYDEIIEYESSSGNQVAYFKPGQINKYNRFCQENEKKYIDNFINTLYN